MVNIDCVIKRSGKYDNDIEWEALYVDGVKQIENYKLDLSSVIDVFSPGTEPYILNMNESDTMYNIHNIFPEDEDFSHLLDYTDVDVGDTIFLEIGECVVLEKYESFRPSGYYKYYDTIDNMVIETDIYYEMHPVTILKIVNSDKEYIWEDYNYRQSYLYNLK